MNYDPDRDPVDPGSVELLRRFADGDESALEHLIEVEGARLLPYIERRLPAFLRRRVGASDILQNTVVDLLDVRERFEDRGVPAFRKMLNVMADLAIARAIERERAQKRDVGKDRGPGTLAGTVRVVDPFGFTKVSALGIEEQRVNVRIDLTSEPDRWSRLGHGYQVEARVVLWEGDVVKLPLTALFRHGGEWSVFVEEQGRARVRAVEVGWRTGLEAEITAGVEPGEQVVVSPSDRVGDGVRIGARRELERG